MTNRPVLLNSKTDKSYKQGRSWGWAVGVGKCCPNPRQAAESKERKNGCRNKHFKLQILIFLHSKILKASKQIKINSINNSDHFKILNFYQGQPLLLRTPAVKGKNLDKPLLLYSSRVEKVSMRITDLEDAAL